MHLPGRVLPALGAALLCFGGPARAATFFVAPGESIQAAVQAATDGDRVLLRPGVHWLTNEVSITKGITLGSVDSWTSTVIDGNHKTRCVVINHTNAIVENLTIRWGWTATQSGAGIYCAGGTVWNCLIEDNAITTSNDGAVGGGVYLTAGGRMQDCLVVGNKAGYGGGVFAEVGTSVLECWFEGNFASGHGGGAYIRGRLTGGSLQGNVAGDCGGGAYCSSGVVEGCIVAENMAREGGGVYSRGVAENCTILRNRATSAGGGTYTYAGGVFRYCTIYTNQAPTAPDWYSTAGPNQSSTGHYEYCGAQPPPSGFANYRLNALDEVEFRAEFQTSTTNRYAFLHWEVDGAVANTNETLSVVVSPPRRVRPVYRSEAGSRTVTFETSAGSAYRTGWLEEGFFLQTPEGVSRSAYATGRPYNAGLFYRAASSQQPLVVTNAFGSSFSLRSVALARYSTSYSSTQVPFVGYRSDGSTVAATFTLDYPILGTTNDFRTFLLPSSFANLVCVKVSATGFSMDDLVVAPVSANDADGDGLDDGWERTSFGGLNRDGTGDFDGDGFTDEAEFVAQTRAEDPLHGFKVAAVDATGSEPMTLRWMSVIDRRYSILSATNLLGPWQKTLSVPGTGAEMEFHDAPAVAPQRFFRLSVRLE